MKGKNELGLMLHCCRILVILSAKTLSFRFYQGMSLYNMVNNFYVVSQ